MDRPHAARRGGLVPGLLRAGLGLRPGLAADARHGRRWRLRHQRPEDLDLDRARGRHDLLPGAHRTRRREACGHQLPAVLDEDARHRGAPAQDHDGPRRVQRGLLHRRARAAAPDRGPARRRLEGGQRHAQARARLARQPQPHDPALPGTRRADAGRGAGQLRSAHRRPGRRRRDFRRAQPAVGDRFFQRHGATAARLRSF
ncbi:hypothetical protein D9M69_520270 [compost metagenome]